MGWRFLIAGVFGLHQFLQLIGDRYQILARLICIKEKLGQLQRGPPKSLKLRLRGAADIAFFFFVMILLGDGVILRVKVAGDGDAAIHRGDGRCYQFTSSRCHYQFLSIITF